MNSYPLITPLVGVSGSRGSDPQTRGGTGKKKAKRHRGEPGHTRDTVHTAIPLQYKPTIELYRTAAFPLGPSNANLASTRALARGGATRMWLCNARDGLGTGPTRRGLQGRKLPTHTSSSNLEPTPRGCDCRPERSPLSQKRNTTRSREHQRASTPHRKNVAYRIGFSTSVPSACLAKRVRSRGKTSASESHGQLPKPVRW